MILGEWHLCDVVQDHVDAVDGIAHDAAVTDVAFDEFNIARTVVGVVEVKYSDVVARGVQPGDDERPEVSASTGD